MRNSILLFTILLIPILSCSNPAEDYVDRAHSNIIREDYKGALEDLNKAIELDPNNAIIYILRGIVKKSMGNNEGAIEDYSKAIEIDVNESTAYFNRGNLKFSQGEYKASIDDYNRAIEASQGDPYHYYAHYYESRSIAKRKINDHSGADDDYNKYLELMKSNEK